MKKIGLLLLGAVLAGYCGLQRVQGMPAEGAIDVTAEPVQEETGRAAFDVETAKGMVKLQPRAAFDVSAVVAAAESYRFDAVSFLSPVDLVLTWGQLPDEPYEGQVTYSQAARFYFWRTPSNTLDLRYIESHSANMHMIPATPNLRKALRAVDDGDLVRIKGLLVNASTAEGFTWGTSMNRTDTGPGACELIWVEELQVGRKVYR